MLPFRLFLEPLEDRLVATTTQFAIIGDYGNGSASERDVANLVKSWNPDVIITLGDNNYPVGDAAALQQNIGQFYGDFIASDRFFPSLGNHDWGTPGATPYLDYFELPGNERYYTFTLGEVQFFALDSDRREPDGKTSTSVQGQWLQQQLAASTALWKIVYFHHPSYSSGDHGSDNQMKWPFRDWGATAVLAGHDHVYERLFVDGLPYFVNGLGGASIASFGSVVAGSQFRYRHDYGAMRAVANETQLTFEFINRAGTLIDTYTIFAGSGLPVVNVVTTDGQALEGTTDTASFAISRSGDLSLPLTVAYTTNGTASSGDYSALSGSVTIPQGQSSATVIVSATGDSAVEGSETLVIRLTATSSYNLGAGSATLSLVDDAEVVVPLGSVWKYLDDGSDQGTQWQQPAFDDTAWKSGRAQFGYGEGDEATVLSYGPDANAKYLTTYFRHAFTVNDPESLVTLALRMLRDDGVVIYLNGVEAFRNNMPTGAVNYKTVASSNLTGAPEREFVVGALAPGLLVDGTNVLAVEIHQRSVTSSDLSFDLALTVAPTSNTTPEIGHLDDVFVAEDTSTLIDVHVSDHETAPHQLTLTVVSSNPDLVRSGGMVLGGSGADRTLRLQPVLNRSGTATITVSVSDGVASRSRSFELTVLPAPELPSVTPAATHRDAQTTAGLVITPSFLDGPEVTHFKISQVSNGSLFLSDGLQRVNDGAFITLAQGKAGLRFTPAAGLAGPQHRFGFMVQAAIGSGDAGLSAAVSVDITVDERWVELGGGGTPTFNWGPITNAVAYDVWVDDLTTRTSAVLRNTEASGTSWTSPTALTPGHRYRWWAGAVQADGSVVWGDALDFTMPTLQPPTLVGPSGTSATDTPVFDWVGVNLARYYDVWVNDVTAGQAQVLRNERVNGTSWAAATALTPGHHYRWWVGAVSGDGTLVWSKAAAFTIPPLGAPAALGPTGTLTTDVPVFTWTAADKADHYDVWVDNLTTGKEQVLRNKTAAGESWAPAAALTPGQRYRWWVGAVSADGTTTWGGFQDFTIPQLSAPTLADPVGTLTTDTPTFSWTSVDLATRYDVWVDDLSTRNPRVLHQPGVTATSWTAASPLTPGQRYRWWVGAVSANGTTVWSAHRDFTVPALATPQLTGPAGDTTDALPTLTWDPVDLATHYDVWVDDVTARQSQVLRERAVNGTSWTATVALTRGHTYRWWVQALSASNTAGPWSDPLDFTVVSEPAAPASGNGEFVPFTILGALFEDVNANGVRETGENGLAGFTVFLDSNRNRVLDAGEVSTLSDADGYYTFENLVPGPYQVWVAAQAGWQTTTPDMPEVTPPDTPPPPGCACGFSAVCPLVGLCRVP